MEANHRTEQVCLLNEVQDGDQPVSPLSCLEGRLDGLDRPEECLPSGPRPSGEQEVRSVCGLRQGLPVHGTILCFGLSTAPQVFTRFMTPVSAMLHDLGIRILRYLDDWLILASSLVEALWERDIVLDLCRQLEILIDFDKSPLSVSIFDLPGDGNQEHDLEGFPIPG